MTVAKIVYLAVVTMCAATIAVISVGFTKQIQSNRRAVKHLCGLAEITARGLEVSRAFAPGENRP